MRFRKDEMIATICVRAGSVRVPNKWARCVGDTTLLHTTIKQARSVFDKVIVSSDSEFILHAANKWDAADTLLRPPELATSTASKWDVFKHIHEHYPTDIMVDLDVGCPLRSLDDIKTCAEMLDKYDLVTTAYEAERNPYFNMVEKRWQGEARIIFDFWKEEGNNHTYTNSQEAPPVYSLSPAVYAFRTSALEYGHWSQVPSWGIHIIPRERAWDIDTELDLEIVKFLWQKRATD